MEGGMQGTRGALQEMEGRVACSRYGKQEAAV